jgi:hypothetical protein
MKTQMQQQTAAGELTSLVKSHASLRSNILTSLLALIVLSGLLVPSAALATEPSEFGIVPGSFAAGTYTGEGATGPLGEDATPDTWAGDHPYEAMTRFKLDTIGTSPAVPAGDVKNVAVELPPGFVGDPNATPLCLPAVLSQSGLCPNDTAVGIASVTLYDGSSDSAPDFLPIYNMVPSTGELALFEFHIPSPSLNIPIHVSVRSAGDYGVTATVSEVSQVAVPFASTVTLWGVPADPTHDPYRGSCLDISNGSSDGSCPSEGPVRPFLADPTQCDGQPLASYLHVDSWEDPDVWGEAGASSPALTGCETLVFDPSLEITPETSAIDTPTGVEMDLHVPQNEDPYGLATPDLRNATVTLPRGMAISPAAATGLEGCTPEEIGLHTEDPVACPNGAKLGSVSVASPDLPESATGSEGELTGAVYLGALPSGPITAPPYTIYLVAEGYGVSIRLQGTVSANSTTGQLTTTFEENPPLPFDDLKIDFFGGPRAALMTPPTCGSYTTTSELTPYSSSVPATPSSTFATSFDGNGAACPNPLPFGPSFSAGATNTTAGGFGSFVLNVSLTDGQQALSQITLSPPPGLLGMLSTVPLCGEPQAAQGTCSEASKIGTATARAGAGSEPFTVSGPVYMTGPYNGAPFGLSVVIPAVAGPFDFGTVIVRSAIYVEPHTARMTVVSAPLPQMVDTSQTDSGVPVALQSVSVDIDRPGFIFNPTSCEALSVSGTLTSNQGTSVPVSSPFKATGCSGLSFHPSFSASTQGKASKASGASLDVKVTSSAGQTNVAKLDIEIPKQLPSRLTTLQKACVAAIFEANPAACPVASDIGSAIVHTPVLNNPLAGPMYLVSHGGEAFPDVEVVLQANERGGEIEIVLDGKTQIKNGVTYSHFDTIPDAPFTSFEAELPMGKSSIFSANLPQSAKYNFCGQALSMPITFAGQNGATLKETTKLAVTGCPKAKKAVKKKPAKARKASRNRGAKS